MQVRQPRHDQKPTTKDTRKEKKERVCFERIHTGDLTSNRGETRKALRSICFRGYCTVPLRRTIKSTPRTGADLSRPLSPTRDPARIWNQNPCGTSPLHTCPCLLLEPRPRQPSPLSKLCTAHSFTVTKKFAKPTFTSLTCGCQQAYIIPLIVFGVICG